MPIDAASINAETQSDVDVEKFVGKRNPIPNIKVEEAISRNAKEHLPREKVVCRK